MPHSESVLPLGVPIAPTEPTDGNSTHIAEYGRGGLHSVSDLTARGAIATDRKKVGMLVWVESEVKYYRLSALPNTWVELSTGGGVTSVNGETGVVVLDAADVGAAAAVHTHAIADVIGLQAALDDAKPLTKTARNDTASTITKGQVVYIFGSSGTHLLVRLADADSELTAAPTIGVAMANIAAGADGDIMVAGYLEGLSNLPTGTFANGASLWLSQTAGGWTTTPPTQPAHRVFLGWVVTNSNGAAGRAYIKVINGQELDELHDVLITGTTDGLPLVYENSTSLWKNKKLTSAGLENNSVGTAQLKDGEVTFPKIADIGSGLLLGRASVGTGDIEGLTLSADFAIDSIGGQVQLASRAARSVMGNPTAGTAAPTDITASADGQVLRRSGGTLSFGAPPAAGSATQVMVNVGGDLGGYATFTYDSVANRMTVGSIGLFNGEFIRNTVNGRLDFMPNPHPSGDFGVYFDLTSSANYAIVGTIDSAGNLDTNAGFQFANTLAIASGKYLDFGFTGGLASYFAGSGNNGVWQFAPYMGSGHAGAMCLVSQSGLASSNRRPTTAHTNPTFYAYAAGDANANDFARLSHDATDGTLESGRGKMRIKAASRVRIEGSAGWFDLPAGDGTNGQVLTTNGSGNASWSTPSGGGVSKAFAIAMAVAL
jgi:hypothetical protein